MHDLAPVVGQFGSLFRRDYGYHPRREDFARVSGEDAINLLPYL